MRRPLLLAALLVLATTTSAPAAAPRHVPGPKPGPPILHAKPPRPAPQLRNRGIWQARPLLVSGASAYRRGEFLYQDFIYDDHGARAQQRDPSDPRRSGDTFSQPGGTYTYPTDVERYRNNVADLVELRVKPLRRATAFRLTFNSMTDPELVATTIALGESKRPRELPYGANALAPARRFLVVSGERAKLLAARGLEPLRPAPRARVSKRRRQITVRVPHRAWYPGRRTVRMAAGVGLWDAQARRYVTPGQQATEARPGGAVGLERPTALFNVAFRFDEPFQSPGDLVGVLYHSGYWRSRRQGSALATNNLYPFAARVDFAKLRRGERDLMRGEPEGVPARGPMNRILTTRLATGQGADWQASCSFADCDGQLLGRLQPYAIYVPRKPKPRRGFGLTLLLHSLAANYNQFLGTRNQRQFGERGKGHIVITSESRGPDGWYYDRAGAEVFEVWADVARRYELAPRRAAIAGYSMGGYGTYKLAAQFPDLFTAGQPTVGPPGRGVSAPPVVNPPATTLTTPLLPSLRHVPLMIWNALGDELVPTPGVLAHVEELDALGYRYVFDLFLPADHLTLAANDQYAPAARFLGERRVVRNPRHVTYVRHPDMDFAEVGTKADQAYWLSGIRTRGAGRGFVDAVSHAFGRADPPVGPTQRSTGTLTGGAMGPIPYTRQSRSWGKAPRAAPRDRLELTLRNIERLRISASRARLSCRPKLDVTTNGPVEIVLLGCGRTLRFG